MDKIEGVIITPLKKIYHPFGDIYHGMKKSDQGYSGFAEAYFSTIQHKKIKAWKKHKKMILNLVVPVGSIKFVLYDDRSGSTSNGNFFQISLNSENYSRLTIPSNIWMGFQGIGEELNLLLNLADIEHDPEEMARKNIEEINYIW